MCSIAYAFQVCFTPFVLNKWSGTAPVVGTQLPRYWKCWLEVETEGLNSCTKVSEVASELDQMVAKPAFLSAFTL